MRGEYEDAILNYSAALQHYQDFVRNADLKAPKTEDVDDYLDCALLYRQRARAYATLFELAGPGEKRVDRAEADRKEAERLEAEAKKLAAMLDKDLKYDMAKELDRRLAEVAALEKAPRVKSDPVPPLANFTRINSLYVEPGASARLVLVNETNSGIMVKLTDPNKVTTTFELSPSPLGVRTLDLPPGEMKYQVLTEDGQSGPARAGYLGAGDNRLLRIFQRDGRR